MRRRSISNVAGAVALGGLVLWSLAATLGAQEISADAGLAAHYYQDVPHWDGAWPDARPIPAADPADWTFTTYGYTRIEPLVNHLFIREGWFTVRWQGLLDTHPGQPQSDDACEYALTIWADDGCRLFIDGNPVIDSWVACSESSPDSRRTVTIELTRGKHTIALEYFQGQSLQDDDADPVKLYWACTERNIPEQVVPAAHLSHTVDDLIPRLGRND